MILTVAQLIARLRMYDPDLPVVLADDPVPLEGRLADECEEQLYVENGIGIGTLYDPMSMPQAVEGQRVLVIIPNR